MAARFYAVYTAAFAGRPAPRLAGQRMDRADQRRPGLSRGLDPAGVGGRRDTGFVAGDTGGWIAQVGVVPAARQGVATRLIVEVLRRMREAGETRAVFDVNVNNPGAIGLYERLGFARAGRRARYARTARAAPRAVARAGVNWPV